MNVKLLGDMVYTRQTRPQEMIDTFDAAGNKVSTEYGAPAEVTVVKVLEVPAAAPASAMSSILPVALALGAAYFLAKG